ncbi:MAG: hypothetical protein H6935_15235 [Thiobacillus sp.]|nr:hypothetical protein [Thiobacillus sp.]
MPQQSKTNTWLLPSKSIGHVRTFTSRIALILLFATTSAMAADYLCHYQDKPFRLAEGHFSLGIDGTGVEVGNRGGYYKPKGHYYNRFQAQVPKGNKLSVKAKSRNFPPLIWIIDDKDRRHYSKDLGRTSSGWVSEVTFDYSAHDSGGQTKAVDVFVSPNQDHQPQQWRGTTVYISANLHKEQCHYFDKPKPRPPINPPMPDFNPCPPGQRPVPGTGMLGSELQCM